ncbi:tRNA (adenosine(37)-N6)-threonylcarbamoyltransferase complex dimerization subunit type 1 TsaB [Polynucleobacter sp. es-EL-1]|uniref:tRNA (adenosine(37)-N6)-threonylcarbamoyltransferase complex dimerization subunit type 1 TsaB n=1 Tax=Polynucleobacter sp. es-EL-1 TaxID=1855652 RepID=UPI002111085F|nr:tRNA (adenosine(37)-N6)-threonylcarbamoyltransferase complex dimerization subunit type 1 TsaB [Polynucleobacter sp. es-EL-1]QWE11379.1 tRNA (adenosine(37)-N6)-threonylcarbamoyltransferase complex dimerization subunit type 1 TsaB [Polynucleobacter sp. es-EL-1]
MTHILAIDTSTAWCSVALSLADQSVCRHEKVSAGASQLLLPWVDELLQEQSLTLTDIDAVAIGIGPGAFTGVRLGVAVVQGLAIAKKLPVLPVASLDAIASQLVLTPHFLESQSHIFMVAVDARMGEVYWARYQVQINALPQRLGEIQLSTPELVELDGIEYIAGSAINEFGERLLGAQYACLSDARLNRSIGVDALGVLACAKQMWAQGLQQDVHLLEPLYVRNKVAFTAQERSQQHG